MTVEIHTLNHLSVTISALLGLLLLYGWRRDRNVPALGWWGAGFVVVAAGLALVAARGAVADVLSIIGGNATLFLGAAVLWTGFRVFEGRRPMWPAMAAGPVLWVVLCMTPVFYGAINTRVVIASSIIGIYTFLGALELWRGRKVPLLTRWAAIILLTFHSAFFFARVVLTLVAPLRPEGPVGAGSAWFLFVHYESILFEIALAFSMVAMAKERAGQKLVIA